MIKRALVLGAQIRGIRGVHNDTARIAALLAERGFRERDIDVRRGESGTRESMLDGYDRLIRDSAAGDAAVLYYSGHGAFVENRDATVSGPRAFQCIVPTDFDDSTDDDFRGISAWELSIKQAALTARTRNVTVILDCCHSAQMSRDEAAHDAVAKALPHPMRLGVGRYFAALQGQQRDALDQLDPLSNPDAIRLVACGRRDSAYEYTREDGVRTGAFTDALVSVLEEVGEAPLPWSTVIAAVRQRVLALFPQQRPDAEGPTRRRVFSLAEADERGLVPVVPRGEQFRLLAGRIAGLSPGDVYGIVPLGCGEYEDRRAIAKVSVTAVRATSAEADLVEWKNDHRRLPGEAVGVPLQLAAPRRPVAIEAPAPALDGLRAALAATRTLRAAEPDEVDRALATLRLERGELTIADRLGPLYPPARYPEDLPRAVRDLVHIGVAHGVCELVGSHGVAESEVDIEWGAVERGETRPMPATGGSLALGDRIYVRIRNRSRRRLYAHVFNVGLRHRVSLLTSEAPAGVPLDPGSPDHIVAEGVEDGAVTGFELSWPEGLPADVARIDRLLVIVTTAKTNLHMLETQGAAAHDAKGSRLTGLVAQLGDGELRDAGAGRTPADDFLVCQLSYLLHPRKGAIAPLSFAIDEEPLNQRGARDAGAWIRAGADLAAKSGAGPLRGEPVGLAERSAAVAVRLGDLVVEDNKALLSADIRVDALVCTLPRPGDRPYAVQTMRFPGIRDGDRLPLDNALLYHGPVHEFVDICLWVSRDTARSRALADLFADKATSGEFQDAMAALLSAAGGAAPWISAVGAGAVLARMAYDLILGAAGRTIGLYRTSFLSAERFGIGRHPEAALYRAQGFSFSLAIDGVGPPRPRAR